MESAIRGGRNLQTCKTCSRLTHTRAHARSKLVFATLSFLQNAFFGHPFQLRVDGITGYPIPLPFFKNTLATEPMGQTIEKGIHGQSALAHSLGGRQQREDVASVLVQRLGEGKNCLKIRFGDAQAKQRNHSVAYVFGRYARVGRKAGTSDELAGEVVVDRFLSAIAGGKQRCKRPEQGYDTQHTAKVDGDTGDGALHGITMNGSGTDEKTGQMLVERLFLLGRQLQTNVAYVGSQTVEQLFPVFSPLCDVSSLLPTV